MPGRRREKRGPAAYARTARVNEVLREVVAEALERMADTDDRLRLLTVTSVEITPDLSRAKVYLSSLPAPAVEALAEQRRELASSGLITRIFKYDTNPANNPQPPEHPRKQG